MLSLTTNVFVLTPCILCALSLFWYYSHSVQGGPTVDSIVGVSLTWCQQESLGTLRGCCGCTYTQHSLQAQGTYNKLNVKKWKLLAHSLVASTDRCNTMLWWNVGQYKLCGHFYWMPFLSYHTVFAVQSAPVTCWVCVPHLYPQTNIVMLPSEHV